MVHDFNELLSKWRTVINDVESLKSAVPGFQLNIEIQELEANMLQFLEYLQRGIIPTHQLRVISVEVSNLIVVLDDQLEFAKNLPIKENDSGWTKKNKSLKLGKINDALEKLELIFNNANLLESHFKVIEDFLKTQ